VKCLRDVALRWRLPDATTVRQVTTLWALGASELKVKRFFVPARQATEIYPELLGKLPVTPSPGGGLPRLVIAQEIRRNTPRVRACYERALQRVRLEGKLKVRWVIGPEGRVVSAEAETKLDDDVDACVLGVVRAMTFPPPEGGGNVNVTYPWIFKMAGDED
jgi:TonB family protein